MAFGMVQLKLQKCFFSQTYCEECGQCQDKIYRATIFLKKIIVYKIFCFSGFDCTLLPMGDMYSERDARGKKKGGEKAAKLHKSLLQFKR